MRRMCTDIFFFFKQKTAYEMRISDWSSDVCSSDLPVDAAERGADKPGAVPDLLHHAADAAGLLRTGHRAADRRGDRRGDGAAACDGAGPCLHDASGDRKSTRLNSSH